MLSLYQALRNRKLYPSKAHTDFYMPRTPKPSTAGALTAALLHCQPFHVGIKLHLIVSTQIISNRARKLQQLATSKLQSSGAPEERSWFSVAVTVLHRGLCSATPVPAAPELQLQHGGKEKPCSPHSIFSPEK